MSKMASQIVKTGMYKLHIHTHTHTYLLYHMMYVG
nr:hypothetical protein NALGGIOA_00107 [Oryctes rhinoceros nudivirus]